MPYFLRIHVSEFVLGEIRMSIHVWGVTVDLQFHRLVYAISWLRLIRLPSRPQERPRIRGLDSTRDRTVGYKRYLAICGRAAISGAIYGS